MAKATISHKCGHDVVHQLYGPTRDRENKAQWLERQDCIECERNTTNQAAAEAAKVQGLPALEGSEKQVTWAETLRVVALEAIEKGAAELLKKVATLSLSAEAREDLDRAITRLRVEARDQTEARYWIDGRTLDHGAQTQIREIRDRNLAPTLLAEMEAIRAAKEVARG